ncbi:MAG TPA: DMT family transporter [Anaerolineales bacterium]|jgi:uncharacterized membrane protein
MLSILFGIGSALCWGAADFTGGLASKRAQSYHVLILSEAAGLLPVIVMAIVANESIPPLAAWLWSGAASVLGTFGLLILYRALATGQMTVTAPVSALLAAAVPVLVGVFIDGLPDWATFLGFGLALAAIWTISQTGAGADWRVNFRELRLPFIAGIFFGSYFVLIHQATHVAFFWPLINGRLLGTLVMLGYAGALRGPMLPPRQVWPLAILSGLVDVAGSVCYILAARAGRMDVAAVLAALYPGSTVILAWIFLKERISRPQIFGIMLALAAIALMTL